MQNRPVKNELVEMKPVESLTLSDLQENPVWKYTNNDELGETSVRPVKKFPVASLAGKIIGTQVRLSSGPVVWALIGNIDANNKRLNKHFLTLSLERNGKWFHLARYHDFDFSSRGPDKLAQFLGLPVDDVFPISYDVRKFSRGNPDALTDAIEKEPQEKLSRAEIIKLVFD
jgi:hypothetical protein